MASGPSPPKPYERASPPPFARTESSALASSFMTSTPASAASVATPAASTALVATGATASTAAAANLTRGTYGSQYSTPYGAATGSLYGGSAYGSSYSSPYSSSYSGYGGGYGSSYGGYGGYGSGYGGGYGSGYGSYGGYGSGYGAYGGSAYGPYGGGYGMGGPMDPNNPYGPNKLLNGGQYVLNGVQTSVQSFGRISQLLQGSFEALHMSFQAVVNLLGNVSFLRQEMLGIGKTFTTLRFLHLLYLKARKLLHLIFGLPMPKRPVPRGPPLLATVVGPNGQPMQQLIPPQLHGAMNDVWADAEAPWAWIPMCLTLAVAWALLRWVWRRASAALWPPTPQQLAAQFAEQQKREAEAAAAAVAAANGGAPPGMQIQIVHGPSGPVPVFVPAAGAAGAGAGALPAAPMVDANGNPMYPPQPMAYPALAPGQALPQFPVASAGAAGAMPAASPSSASTLTAAPVVGGGSAGAAGSGSSAGAVTGLPAGLTAQQAAFVNAAHNQFMQIEQQQQQQQLGLARSSTAPPTAPAAVTPAPSLLPRNSSASSAVATNPVSSSVSVPAASTS